MSIISKCAIFWKLDTCRLEYICLFCRYLEMDKPKHSFETVELISWSVLFESLVLIFWCLFWVKRIDLLFHFCWTEKHSRLINGSCLSVRLSTFVFMVDFYSFFYDQYVGMGGRTYCLTQCLCIYQSIHIAGHIYILFFTLLKLFSCW